MFKVQASNVPMQFRLYQVAPGVGGTTFTNTVELVPGVGGITCSNVVQFVPGSTRQRVCQCSPNCTRYDQMLEASHAPIQLSLYQLTPGVGGSVCASSEDKVSRCSGEAEVRQLPLCLRHNLFSTWDGSTPPAPPAPSTSPSPPAPPTSPSPPSPAAPAAPAAPATPPAPPAPPGPATICCPPTELGETLRGCGAGEI